MSILDGIDLAPFQRIYMLANTPTFLYKHFRDLPEEALLARNHSAHELVEAFNDYSARVPQTGDAVVRAYVALVALNYADYGSVKTAIANGIRTDRLRWAKPILDAILGLHQPIMTATIIIPPNQPTLANAPIATASGSPSLLEVKPPPPTVQPEANSDNASSTLIIRGNG